MGIRLAGVFALIAGVAWGRMEVVSADYPSISGAIAACAEGGGGRVTVPKGSHFSKGPIVFRSNIELHLEEGAVVEFSDDFDDYGNWLNNSDGIDIECSRDVLVENCSFRQHDDAIVIKAGKDRDGRRLATPTENVVVRNCMVRGGPTFCAIGSELSGGIRPPFRQAPVCVIIMT